MVDLVFVGFGLLRIEFRDGGGIRPDTETSVGRCGCYEFDYQVLKGSSWCLKS